MRAFWLVNQLWVIVPVNPRKIRRVEISVSVSVYLFAIEKYMKRNKKKSNYLDSHGGEAQKKPAGLWRMGSLR